MALDLDYLKTFLASLFICGGYTLYRVAIWLADLILLPVLHYVLPIQPRDRQPLEYYDDLYYDERGEFYYGETDETNEFYYDECREVFYYEGACPRDKTDSCDSGYEE